ncbi:MAG: MFS transporter, partial [Pseudomonadales bacterium]
MQPEPAAITQRRSERKSWLRRTLRLSQQEGVAASLMTATSDHFFNACAIFLQASLSQMGWVTGLPQLFGAAAQLCSVWLANHFHRKPLITITAAIQASIVVAMGILAALRPDSAVWIFIILAALYHSSMNVIQPHWRSWMGSIVPERRRGKFFAFRGRLTMATSMCVFIAGGVLLTATDDRGYAGLGFLALFMAAATGRLVSAGLLWQMHDPEPHQAGDGVMFRQTLYNFGKAWRDKTFRHYSLFVAFMLAMVAISAPFFAVYM